MTQRVYVIRDDLLLLADISRVQLEVLREHISKEGLDLHVLGLSEGEVVDLRDAPPEITAKARVVIDWIETHA